MNRIAQSLLEAAAVYAAPAPPAVLSALLGDVSATEPAHSEALAAAIQSLIEAGLLLQDADGCVQLAEPAEAGTGAGATYANIPPQRRISLHRAAARYLSDSTGGLEGDRVVEIALHLIEAGDSLGTARHLCEMGRRWESLRVPALEASEALERGLRLCERSEDPQAEALRLELLYHRAAFLLRREHWDAAEDALEHYRQEARSHGAPGELPRHEARFSCLAGMHSIMQVRYDEARDAIVRSRRACAEMPEADEERRELEARCIWVETVLMHGEARYNDATKLVQKLVDYPPGSRGGWVRARAWSTLAIASYTRGNAERCAEEAHRGAREAEACGARDRAIIARVLEANARLLAGDFGVGLALSQRAVDEGEAWDEMSGFFHGIETLSHGYLELGATEMARPLLDPEGRYAAQFERLEEFPWVSPLVVMVRGRLWAMEGNWPAAEEILEAAADTMLTMDDRINLPLAYSMLALGRARAGRHDEAQKTATAAEDAARGEEGIMTVPGLVVSRIAAAEVALLAGDAARCRQLAEEVQDRCELRGLRPHALRALALRVRAARAAGDATASTLLPLGREWLQSLSLGLPAELAHSLAQRPFAQIFAP